MFLMYSDLALIRAILDFFQKVKNLFQQTRFIKRSVLKTATHRQFGELLKSFMKKASQENSISVKISFVTNSKIFMMSKITIIMSDVATAGTSNNLKNATFQYLKKCFQNLDSRRWSIISSSQRFARDVLER